MPHRPLTVRNDGLIGRVVPLDLMVATVAASKDDDRVARAGKLKCELRDER
jgi:hypothetical protein